MKARLARCSLGHVGLVRDRKKITYPDGSSAVAWVGIHLWPLRFIGKPWSSRNPRWILAREIRDDGGRS